MGMRTQRPAYASMIRRAQATALAAEHEEGTRPVGDLGEGAVRLTGEQVQLGAAVRLEERLGARPAHEVDLVPVVAARTARGCLLP